MSNLKLMWAHLPMFWTPTWPWPSRLWISWHLISIKGQMSNTLHKVLKNYVFLYMILTFDPHLTLTLTSFDLGPHDFKPLDHISNNLHKVLEENIFIWWPWPSYFQRYCYKKPCIPSTFSTQHYSRLTSDVSTRGFTRNPDPQEISLMFITVLYWVNVSQTLPEMNVFLVKRIVFWWCMARQTYSWEQGVHHTGVQGMERPAECKLQVLSLRSAPRKRVAYPKSAFHKPVFEVECPPIHSWKGRHTDKQKVMHMRQSCISTGGLRNQDPQSISVPTHKSTCSTSEPRQTNKQILVMCKITN